MAMKKIKKIIKSKVLVGALAASMVVIGMTGCGDSTQNQVTGTSTNASIESKEGLEGSEGVEVGGNEGSEGNEDGTAAHPEGSGHAEGGEAGDPATPIKALDQTCDNTINGMRVQMAYEANTRTFTGNISNTTNQTLKNVLVEMNIKNGTKTVVELGPLQVGDLKAGDVKSVKLAVDDEPAAKGLTFDGYQVHPEADNIQGASREGNEESEGTESEEGATLATSGLTLDQTYDVTNYGTRTILKYDINKKAFKGTVENLTNKTLSNVRVEIHLDNGSELGPVFLGDLKGRGKIDVTLDASGEKGFSIYVAHAEVSGSEHGANGDTGTEGGNEGSEGSSENHNEGSEG